MPHEYRHHGYGRPRGMRGEERYAEGRGWNERDDYEARYESNAPLEWDGRRYGRDFNDDPSDGGRGVYQRDVYQRDAYRNEGRAYRRAGHELRDADAGRIEWESRPQYSRRADSYAGRSNYGSNRYGGSDYRSDDYDYPERSYSTPHTEATGNRSYGPQNEIVGTNWHRTAGGGEWYAGESPQYRNQIFGRSSGQGNQGFRGRGPKDYKRTDERLKETVCELLTDAPHIDASEITVSTRNGEVTLSGTVTDRGMKHAAEDLIESRAGVNEVNNQLRVKNDSETDAAWDAKSPARTNSSASGSLNSASAGKPDSKHDYGAKP